MHFRATFLALLASGTLAASAADLVRDGVPRCLIVTSATPGPGAKTGAKLLSDHGDDIADLTVAPVELAQVKRVQGNLRLVTEVAS